MPFLMDADRAASIILSGIKKEKRIIQFPFPIAIGAKLLKLCPTRFLKLSLHEYNLIFLNQLITSLYQELQSPYIFKPCSETFNSIYNFGGVVYALPHHFFRSFIKFLLIHCHEIKCRDQGNFKYLLKLPSIVTLFMLFLSL